MATVTHQGGTTGDQELCRQAAALLGTNHSEDLQQHLEWLDRCRQRAAGREDADPDASELAHMDRVDFRCASAAAKATEELVSAGHVVEYRD